MILGSVESQPFRFLSGQALRKVREKWAQVGVQKTDAKLGHRAITLDILL